MSQFAFLQAERPALHDAATKAESFANPDPRTACFFARRGLEVVMNPELLYESPFTDITPQGPDGLFSAAQVDALVALLNEIRASAVA